MGLLILSKKVIGVQETLKSALVASYLSGLKFYFEEHSGERYGVDVYISKKREEEEYFYLGIEDESEVLENYQLLNLEINGSKYYRLALTDQADYDHLIYDFSLAYLRLNPEHCISLYGDTFFFLKDMEKIESKGGYYNNWCYK